MRQDRKRNKERIRQAAVELVARKGFDAVSFDELAKCAQVSRGTLYNHYDNLGNVIVELAFPVLQEGIDYYGEPPRGRLPLDIMLGAFVMMWKKHGTALNLIECAENIELNDLKELHDKFVDRFRKVLMEAEKAPGGLPLGTEQTGALVSNLFLPVLRTLEGDREWELKFLKVMKGALLCE